MEVVPLNRIKWLSTLVPPKELVPQQKKMTKYTGPTQDTKDDKSLQQLGKKLYFGIIFGSFIHVHVHYVHDHHGHGG